jgi:ribosomal-protein-alanine N-acetyltransferase
MADLVVRGPTLTLRYATEADAPALFALADPEATRWFSWGPYADDDAPLDYIRSLEVKRESGALLDFLAVHDEHGPVGVTGLSEYARRDRRATVGTWFGRAHWGTGVNAESKALIAHLAFATLGFHRLTAWANTRNGRSQVSLERLGFRREGVLRAYNTHSSGIHDVVAYGMLPADWLASPLHDVPVTVTGDPPDVWLPEAGEDRRA